MNVYENLLLWMSFLLFVVRCLLPVACCLLSSVDISQNRECQCNVSKCDMRSTNITTLQQIFVTPSLESGVREQLDRRDMLPVSVSQVPVVQWQVMRQQLSSVRIPHLGAE